METQKLCKHCNVPLTKERTLCKNCKMQAKRDYVNNRYKLLKTSGQVLKRYGITTCDVCGESMIKNRPSQTTHGSCKLRHKSIPNYNNVKRSAKGNTIARQLIINLGFIGLNSRIHIHHLDENPDNNSLKNLLILSNQNHAFLHRFLEKNWSLLSKDSSSNLENCWDTLRDQLTTTWLETMSVKVKKIVDIGQSAAEPLTEDFIYRFSIEEGSETMYQVSKDFKIYDKDIVQTQNKQCAYESKLGM